MSKRHHIWALAILFCTVSAWAQDSTNSSSQGTQQPVPAYGQENSPISTSDNPPLSGLDAPSLEPHAAPLSYLQPGATLSQSADSNIGNSLGGASFSSVTRGLGSLDLRRLWSNYDLALQYVGGVGYYSQRGQGVKLLQQMDFAQKVSWKRGQLSLRDSFSYLPEGNFGASYGALGSQRVASIGGSAFGAFFGGSALGTLGLVPRILNVAVADINESLTPKSALTAAGGYALTHFYGNDPVTGTTFIGTSQISGQLAYNRILTAHTQVALMYGYQGFDFSVFHTAFHSHVIQAMYGHRISGRMDFLIAAGPQITKLSFPCSLLDYLLGNPRCSLGPSGQIQGSLPDTRIGVAGQARLRYRFPRTSVDLRYERFETSGSGLFAGSQSDIARLSASRPLSRVWSAFADLGYSRNSRLQSSTTSAGVNARRYQDAFLGAGLHRQFGREFHGFASYQFSQLAFDNSFCGAQSGCNHISHRSVLTVGLDWTPRPIRID